jgi:CelD/BcsL family acetyltransferase involved in cellulose biosynthesis
VGSASDSGPLTIDRFRVGDEWDLQRLETEWNQFVESRFPTYFCRDFAWSRAWWQAYAQGDRVEIFVLRLQESGTIVGILPMWVRRETFGGFPVRLLEILGRGIGCEDLLIDQDHVEVAGPALAEILQRVRWDVARFSNLRNRITSQSLRSTGERLGFRVEASSAARSFVTTEGNFDDYFNARRSSFRRNYRAATRRAEAMGALSFRKCDLWTMTAGEIDAAADIAKQSWQYEQGGSHFCHLRNGSLIEGLRESPNQPSGDPELWLMSIGGRDMALNLCVLKAGRLEGIEQAFIQAYGKCSPGVLLLMHVIEQKFQDPQTEVFVLGTGEGYQGRTSDESDPVENLVFFRNSPYGRLVAAARKSGLYQALRRRQRGGSVRREAVGKQRGTDDSA